MPNPSGSLSPFRDRKNGPFKGQILNVLNVCLNIGRNGTNGEEADVGRIRETRFFFRSLGAFEQGVESTSRSSGQKMSNFHNATTNSARST